MFDMNRCPIKCVERHTCKETNETCRLVAGIHSSPGKFQVVLTPAETERWLEFCTKNWINSPLTIMRVWGDGEIITGETLEVACIGDERLVL
jgi:hypothetical protein